MKLDFTIDGNPAVLEILNDSAFKLDGTVVIEGVHVPTEYVRWKMAPSLRDEEDDDENANHYHVGSIGFKGPYLDSIVVDQMIDFINTAVFGQSVFSQTHELETNSEFIQR